MYACKQTTTRVAHPPGTFKGLTLHQRPGPEDGLHLAKVVQHLPAKAHLVGLSLP